MTRRPIVLVLIGAAWPGNDSSGPNQSVKALARATRDRFDFRLVARDRPPGGRGGGVDTRDWTDLGWARIRYRRVGPFGAIGLRALLAETPHDLLWMNSVFDREFTLPAVALDRLGVAAPIPLLLSPRGEFGAGALGVKSAKKRVFLESARRFGLFRGVTLLASSEAEAADIRASLGANVAIKVAGNVREILPAGGFVPADDPATRLAFVGRISPVKQLHYALDILRRVRARVTFDIFGPAEDPAYWRACRKQIAELPANVRVTWRGENPNSEVLAAMARVDLFFLPTAGENFGHAIFEALCGGAPVLISDRTPWRGLREDEAGWDLPLAAPERFVETIEFFATLPGEARVALRRGARARAERFAREGAAVEDNVAALREVLAGVAT